MEEKKKEESARKKEAEQAERMNMVIMLMEQYQEMDFDEINRVLDSCNYDMEKTLAELKKKN